MSSESDPRISRSRTDWMDKEKERAERDHRLEFIRPAIMLAVCGVGVLGYTFLAVGVEGPLIWALIYILQIVFGVLGLWLCATLWLGGVGPLGLAILRLSAIYFAHDAFTIVSSEVGLGFLGWVIGLILYVGLLSWLFDLDWSDAVVLAVVTWVVKVAVGTALLAVFITV